MKKLFTLFIGILLFYGCQDYDDQFDDLNTKISSLTSTVNGLTSLQETVSALSAEIESISDTALSDADLAEILQEVTTVKAAIEAIESTDVSDIETQVDGLDAEVDELLADVDEILLALADLSPDKLIIEEIDMDNLAQLIYYESIIDTSDQAPLVLVEYGVYINVDDDLFPEMSRVNAITNKIHSSRYGVRVYNRTTSDAVDFEFNALTNVGYHIRGEGNDTGSFTAPSLISVGSEFIWEFSGPINYPLLTAVADSKGVHVDHAAGVASVTFINVPGVIVTDSTNGLSFPNAESVIVGGDLPATVNLPSAKTFVSNGATAQGATTITVDGTDQFSIAATSFTGTVNITSSATVDLSQVTDAVQLDIDAPTVNLSGLTTIGGATTIDATSINLSGLTTIAGATTLSATTVDISSLETTSAVVSIVGADTLGKLALTSLGADFLASNVTVFDAEALATSTGTIDIADGATVHLKDLGATTDLVDFATIATLKLFEQDTDIDFSTAAALVTLDYTGKAAATATEGAQNNTLTVSSGNASLTTLTIGAGGLGTLTVSGTSLASLETNGVIINTLVSGNAALAEFDFGHTHVDGDFATTVSIVDNDALVSVDLSDLSKVKHVNITGNASLTTITAPSASSLAEPVTTVTVTIADNDVTGTYTAAVAGTQTTEYQAATLTGESITGFKTFIDAYVAATNTVSFSIEIDSEQSAIAGDSDAETGGQLSDSNGLIDTALELTLMTD